MAGSPLTRTELAASIRMVYSRGGNPLSARNSCCFPNRIRSRPNQSGICTRYSIVYYVYTLNYLNLHGRSVRSKPEQSMLQ